MDHVCMVYFKLKTERSLKMSLLHMKNIKYLNFFLILVFCLFLERKFLVFSPTSQISSMTSTAGYERTTKRNFIKPNEA